MAILFTKKLFESIANYVKTATFAPAIERDGEIKKDKSLKYWCASSVG